MGRLFLNCMLIIIIKVWRKYNNKSTQINYLKNTYKLNFKIIELKPIIIIIRKLKKKKNKIK